MGERIAQLRKSKGLSQAKLAKALGLSASTIAMYEQGRREPSVSILVALVNVLGATIDYLITGQTPLKPFAAPGIADDRSSLAATLLCAAWLIGGPASDKNDSP